MSECQCKKCRAACEFIPGVFTPREAERAIAAGHGDRMMAVFFHDDRRGGFQVLSPISNPKEHERTAISPKLRLGSTAARGRCTFYTDDGRCEVHGTDHKPSLCSETLACHP